MGLKARWALLFGCLTVFARISSFAAGSVTLAWDASPDAGVTGYRIYYGVASGTYTNSAAVGNVTSATLANLNDGVTYYFTATAYDSSGVESPFSNETSYTVSAASTNATPTLNAISAVTIDEDASAQTVSLSGISSGSVSETQTLTVTASSSNPGLIPNPSVGYTSPNTTGSLTFTPVANASGTATITVTVNDGQAANNTVTRTFVVTVNAVNDTPTLNTLSNVTINEDAAVQSVSLSGIGTGAANESQTLTVTATSSNPGLIPNPTVSYTSPNATGSLSFTPVANASGTATITVTVNDAQAANNTVTRTFTVTVNPVNDAPTLNTIANVSVFENAGLQAVSLAGIGTGAADEAQTLTVTATSSNPSLVPNPSVTYTSPNASGSLSFTPTADANGSATITVTVNDGQAANNTVTRTFTVTVSPVNNPPTLNSLTDVAINEDASAQTVSLSGIGTGAANETQTLTVTATSSNPSLIPNPTVTYTSPNATGSLSLTPVAKANGTATVTVTVNDGQATNNTVSRTFTVTVNAVNDVPTLAALSNVSVAGNAGAQTVSLSGIGTGAANETQTLAVTATSSNPSLIPNPTVTYTSPNASGSLSFAPAANIDGSATITVTVNDGQAANNTVTRTFTVTVSQANAQPTLAALSNVTINEDAATQTVALSGIGSGSVNESQTLTVTATSSNPSLIPNPTVAYTSPNATGNLSFTPVAEANGTATISVTVNDGGSISNTVTRTFTVTVNAVNDAPTLNSLTDVTLNEDAGVQTVGLSGIASGATNETQTLTVTATSSNPSLIPNPTVTYTSPSATGSLSFTPVANASGAATITVTVNDGQAANNTVTRSFIVTVNPVNDAPTVNAIANVSIGENSGQQTVSLAGISSGATNEVQALTVTATSSNPSLIPNPTVTYTSPNATGSLSFTPTANSSGTATITVTVDDGQAANNTVVRTFTVAVNLANVPPTLTAISNVSINEDAAAQTVSLTGISSGSVNENQALTVTATSSNPSLIPNPTVMYTSPNTTGSLSFAPVADANGTATISVTVNDGHAVSNTLTRTFTVTVNAVNDTPTLSPLTDVTINEDASAQTVGLSGIGTGAANETQTLTVTATSSNPSLIPNPTVSYSSPSATGNLSFTPVANATGTATITVTVNDSQAANNTVTRSFTVTVNPVNDAPTLNAIANVSIGENSGQQTVGLSGIGTGAANETQTLIVTATSSNPSLIPNPTVVYTSPSATGSLTFTPAANSSGSATITVTVDDGQAANNTVVRTFTVAVNLANVPPTLAALGNVTISEDAAAQTVSLTGISSGSVNESQTLTVTATSSNPSLIPNPTVTYTSPNTTGSLSFAPVADANGTATISVTVNDGHAVSNTLTRTFTVTVNAVNDTPTLSPLTDVTINEDASAQTVGLSGIGTGAANETQTLTVTATSSNPSLIPNPTVNYSNPSATGNLSFTLVANATGTATITVTVNDAQAANNTVVRTFTVTVNPVNDTPTLNAIANVSIGENSGQQTVGLSGIGTGATNETQTLIVTATSSNPSLIPNPTVVYTSPSATGSLTFTPAANSSGSATIMVTVDDGQAANNTVVRTFTVAVNLANVPPTLTAISNVSINEDASAQTVNLAGISSGSVNESQTLIVAATSSNPSLIPNPTVTYTSPNTTGSLSFTPVADASGTATISVTVDDGHAVSNTITRTFTVTVNAVNDAPTLGALADVTLNEDAGAQTVSLAGIGMGAANETQTLAVTATSSNPSLIPNPSVAYTSPNATGTLTFAAVTNGFGSAIITVVVNDGQAANNTVARTFTVTVNPVNDAPTLNAIASVSIGENAGQQTVNLSGIGSGAANESQALTVTAVSSDPSLIPNPTVTYTSPNATGSLSFTPAANQSGSATVTVTVNDGQGVNSTTVRTFTVAVNVANIPPTLAAINNVTVNEDAGAQTVSLSGISSGSANENQTLSVTATSSNPGLVPNPTVTYTSPNTTGSLSFTPVANTSGSASITVVVNDGHAVSNTFSRTFTVTVNPVNDAPTLNALTDVTINEDAGAQTVSLSGISTGSTNETQTLTVTATSSNPSLIPNPTVSYTSPSATGNLSFTPVANANGTATITVTVNDGQAANNTVTRTFVVTVNAVNDAPTLNTIAGLTIAENAAQQTVTLTGIGTGAANETQSLGVTASSSDTSVIPNPTVSYSSPNSTGTLTFTPVANANGTATITVNVNDGQAANNTTTRSFAVTVTAVNSAPTITAIPNQTFVSDTNSGPLSFTIGDVETPAASLALAAASTAPGIVPLTNIVFGGSSSNRTVTVTPVYGVAGSSDITINVTDGASSASTTFTVTVTAPPPAAGQLSVTKTGSGTVSPDLSSTTLIVGQTYTVTATPATGYLFAGWSGSVSSMANTITFTMQSNTVLQANFVTNPYTAASATYNGLFNEADEVRLHSSGSFNLFMDGSGNYSAWVQIGYSRYQFAGTFGANLRATNVVTRWDGTPLTVEFLIGSGATAGQISGRVTDGVWNALLSGGRQVGSTTLAGEYTLVIPGAAGNAALPSGDGYATMHVADDGLATMSATLADGTKYSQSAYLTTDNDLPLYVSLYVGKGSVMSWVTFTNLSSSDLSGNLVWTKLAGASPTSYPLGFTNGTKAVGSAYVMPLDLGKALNLSGAVVAFSGGNLSSAFNNVVSVNSGSQVVNLSPNPLNFRITKNTGAFAGDVQDPTSGQTYTFGGVVLQKQNAAYGTMTGSTLASRVVLAAP